MSSRFANRRGHEIGIDSAAAPQVWIPGRHTYDVDISGGPVEPGVARQRSRQDAFEIRGLLRDPAGADAVGDHQRIAGGFRRGAARRFPPLLRLPRELRSTRAPPGSHRILHRARLTTVPRRVYLYVHPHRRALLQIHFCVVLWGFTAILGKLITLPALQLVWWRMLLVTAALAASRASGAPAGDPAAALLDLRRHRLRGGASLAGLLWLGEAGERLGGGDDDGAGAGRSRR